MIFDRISLVKSYAALKIVELNDGAVKDILFNKTAYYGTKTIERFKTLQDLAAFINENYPYQYFDPKCQCAVTGKDAIWTPLSFNLTLANNRYATFVNNMRTEFESAQEKKLNSTSVSACRGIFSTNAELVSLKKNYSCFEYVINQNQYVAPCEYIELITNEAYRRLVGELYPLSKNRDLVTYAILDVEDPADVLPQVEIPELIITTTTTTAAPTTTTTTLVPLAPNGGGQTSSTTTTAPCQAIDIDGYYPLYTTIACAQAHAGGNGGYHSHDLGNPATTYYMPNGLNQDPNNGTITQWHGTYGQITTTTTTSTTTQPTYNFSPSPGPSSYY